MLPNLSVPANPSTPVLPLAQLGLFLPRLSPRAFMSVLRAGATRANAHVQPPAPRPCPNPWPLHASAPSAPSACNNRPSVLVPRLHCACRTRQHAQRMLQCSQRAQCMLQCTQRAQCMLQCAQCMLQCTQHVLLCTQAPPHHSAARQGAHSPVAPEGCLQTPHGKLAGVRGEPPGKAPARVRRWPRAAAAGRGLLAQEGCTARQQVVN